MGIFPDSAEIINNPQKFRDFSEALGLWLLILLRIWIPYFHYNRIFGGIFLLFALFYIIATQYLRAKSSISIPALFRLKQEAGFQMQQFFPCILRIFPSFLVVLLIIILLDFSSENPQVCTNDYQKLLGYFPWALLQQYLLQGYMFARLKESMPSSAFAILASAFLFGSVHIPNPALTVITFVGGAILSEAFQRFPNLFAVSLAHALIAIALQCLLPTNLLPNMYVGYFYLHPPQ